MKNFIKTFKHYVNEAAKADKGETKDLEEMPAEMQKAILEYKELNKELAELEEKFNITMKQKKASEIEKVLLKQMEDLNTSVVLGKEVALVVEKFNYERSTVQYKKILDVLVETNKISKELRGDLEKQHTTVSSVKGNLQVSDNVEESLLTDKLKKVIDKIKEFANKIKSNLSKRKTLLNKLKDLI